MALERVGLGGVLTFDSAQAVRASGQARDAFSRFTRQAQPVPPLMGRIGQSVQRAAQQMLQGARQIGRGIGQLAGAAQQAGMALLPMTAAVGVGAERAASFEHQMSAVQAITGGTAGDLQTLTAAARAAGIETAFSATQAGQAMEFMARSGASATEIVGGLRGVVDAAAAEGIELATASDIIAQSTRIMGREWSQASNTADILVRTAQRSNTDIIQLGEAMRYGGQSARVAGMDLEQTSAILGRLADAGLRGSVGGTSLQNALSKLARPSRRAQEMMREMRIEMTRTASGGVDLTNISQQLADRLRNIEDPLTRTDIAVEIFGQRGRRAFEALSQAGEESVSNLEAQLRRASEGAGAAAEAAATRLDNLKGALTLFASSLEGVAITIFGPMLEPLKDIVQNVTEYLNRILIGVGAIMDAGDNLSERYEALTTIMENGGETQAGVVLGIVDAINDMRNAFNWVRETVTSLISSMEAAFGADTIRLITRIGIILGIAAAAVGPVLLAVGTLIGLIASIGSGIISGVGSILGVVFLPLLASIGVLIGLFSVIRREGETVGQTFARIWAVIREAALRVWDQGIRPFYEGFMNIMIPTIEEFRVLWQNIVQTFRKEISELAAQFEQFGSSTQISWQEVGQMVALVIRGIITVVLQVIQIMIQVWSYAMGFYMRYGRTMVNNVVQAFSGVITIIGSVVRALSALWSGNIIGGMTHFGQAIMDFMLEPIKSVVRGIAQLADAFGGENLISQRVRDWSRATTPIVRGRGRPTGRGSDLFTGLFGDTGAPAARVAQPTEIRRETERLGERVTRTAARGARRRNVAGSISADIELQDERSIEVNNEVCVDGQQLSVASQRHRTEIGERSGFRTTPWQRRVRAEQGAAPVTER